MKLSISAALKQPGAVFDADLSETFAAQKFAGRIVRFRDPIRLRFAYSYDGGALTIDGSLETAVLQKCARCDEEFIEPVCVAFSERFIKGDEAGREEESYRFEGDYIELDDVALDNFFLAMPIKSVCKEDCNGLCPICGCNLNTAQCDCEAAEKDTSPLHALSQLLNDSKEV